MSSQPNKNFTPLSVKEEYELLASDDVGFSAAKKYILPLIQQIVEEFVEEKNKQDITIKLVGEVPLAAERFLKADPLRKYRFSTYFTWYIAREVNG